MDNFGEFDCPHCGRAAEDFDGTYYKVVDKMPVFDLSAYDLEETKLSLPKEYFPKFGPSIPVTGEFAGLGYDWEETHKCPDCGTEFTFINSSC